MSRIQDILWQGCVGHLAQIDMLRYWVHGVVRDYVHAAFGPHLLLWRISYVCLIISEASASVGERTHSGYVLHLFNPALLMQFI